MILATSLYVIGKKKEQLYIFCSRYCLGHLASVKQSGGASHPAADPSAQYDLHEE